MMLTNLAWQKHRVRLLIGGLAAIAVLAIASGASRLTATTAASCNQLSEGAIGESQEFTPYELMRTKPFDGLINPTGAESAPVPAKAKLAVSTIDGLERQFTVVGTNGAVYSYFLDRPLGAATRSDFLAEGGVQVDQEPLTPDGPFAMYLLATLGDRAVPVKVGPFDGALTWADPDVKGNRSHNLYWSDGEYNYSLISNRSAAAVVNLGRTLVC